MVRARRALRLRAHLAHSFFVLVALLVVQWPAVAEGRPAAGAALGVGIAVAAVHGIQDRLKDRLGASGRLAGLPAATVLAVD